MATTPTFPGVYVQEIPSGVRTIVGVATSVAAFVDYFTKGPMNKAVRVLNQGDFDREFGGLDSSSEASYGIQQFFLNGGTEAWVVRVASADANGQNGPVAARVFIGSAPAATQPADDAAAEAAATLVMRAANEGTWGGNLAVRVEPSESRFNLIVTEYAVAATRTGVARQEVFRNLSMDGDDQRFADRVVNDEVSGSKLVRVTADPGGGRPLLNGTLSGQITGPPRIEEGAAVQVTIGGSSFTATLAFPAGTDLSQPRGLTQVAGVLQAAIRAAKPEDPAFADATVEVVELDQDTGAGRLRVLAGLGSDPGARVVLAAVPGGDTTATDLRLAVGATPLTMLLSGQHTTTPDIPANPSLMVTPGAGSPVEVSPTIATGTQALSVVASALQAALDGVPALAGTSVQVLQDRLLVIPADPADPAAQVSFADAPGGTTATVLKLTQASGAEPVRGLLSGSHPSEPTIPASPAVRVTIDGTSHDAALTFPSTATLPGPQPLADVATALQAAIRTGTGTSFTQATVQVVGDRLLVLPGGASATTQVVFANADDGTLADVLLLSSGAAANVQEYRLGGGFVSQTAQLGGAAGRNGFPPDGTALRGALASKTGIFALEDADLFNLLCLPRVSMVDGDGGLDDNEAGAVLAVAMSYCEKRRAFLLVDTPAGVDELPEILGRLPKVRRHRNAALFYPRVKIPDPLDDFRLRSVGASGTLAGLFARIDAARGVWKAPAGTEASLRNVVELDHLLTDGENGVLNPLGVNCLRVFPIFGPVSWGARTLEGADQQASEWKYIPVRRLALFIEESLYRGTTFAVFEPNDEPLWAQLRLNVGAFMNNLYRKGAFQGSTPNEAFLVKVDAETTTQNDIDLGIVNILVGFRPLKPAEFVFLNIQQLAGQVQA
jgi:phage tail sheath protein FI